MFTGLKQFKSVWLIEPENGSIFYADLPVDCVYHINPNPVLSWQKSANRLTFDLAIESVPNHFSYQIGECDSADYSGVTLHIRTWSTKFEIIPDLVLFVDGQIIRAQFAQTIIEGLLNNGHLTFAYSKRCLTQNDFGLA